MSMQLHRIQKGSIGGSLIGCHLARVAIALLLQNPGLVDIVKQKDIDWGGLEFRGIELFKNILQVIGDKKSVKSSRF